MGSEEVKMIKKTFPIFFVFLLLIYAASASKAETENDDDLLSEMMAAEMFAFGLEGMIFDAQNEFTSYNDVLTFFGKAFVNHYLKNLLQISGMMEKLNLRMEARLWSLRKKCTSD